jgi:thiol:disulfide interchange protein DsbD
MFMKNLFLILFSLFTLLGISQNSLKPVVWNAVYVEKSSTEGEIVFTATVEKKWHIYSQRPTDVGPIPTSFTVAPNSNFELVGKVEEKEAHEEFVAAFDAKVFVFSGEAIFKQKVSRKNKKSFTIDTSLEFMTCNDVQCLPPTTLNFTVSIPEGAATTQN